MPVTQRRLRDPVWQFIGVVVAVAALVFTVFVYLKSGPTGNAEAASSPSAAASAGPKATLSTRTYLPLSYFAQAPGPGCDKGGGRFTRESGKVSCASGNAKYGSDDKGGASVWFDWPGRAFPQAFEVTVHAEDLSPATCVFITVRTRYALGGCAMGDVNIIRYDQSGPVTLAARAFRNDATYLQITAKVNGPQLTVTVYTNSNGDTITLTATDDTYVAEDWIKLRIYTVNTTPASAKLSQFRYQASA